MALQAEQNLPTKCAAGLTPAQRTHTHTQTAGFIFLSDLQKQHIKVRNSKKAVTGTGADLCCATVYPHAFF